MAGTITAGTLSDGSVSTSTTNCIQGSAKAWVNFNGTLTNPITPRASYNVTNVTKNATGDYTVNFTNALSDANYSVSGCAQQASTNQIIVNITATGTMTSSSVPIFCLNKNTTTAIDPTVVTLAVFR